VDIARSGIFDALNSLLFLLLSGRPARASGLARKTAFFKAVMTLLRGRAASDSKTGNARLARVSCRI
jgi:hypothetical protein